MLGEKAATHHTHPSKFPGLHASALTEVQQQPLRVFHMYSQQN